jgi:hypothetical protein
MSGPTGDPQDAAGGTGDSDETERRIGEIEAELRGPAKFKEPSAAERARQPVRPTGRPGWRSKRKARKLREPVESPSAPRPGDSRARSPRPAAGQPRESRRGRTWSLVIAVVVIAGLAGAVYAIPKLALGKVPGTADNTPVTNGATPAAQRTASSAPAASFLPKPTLAAPFLGTPAQSYADGAAGIVIPPARPVGRYTAAQVAAAYRMTRKLLIAASLNGPTLAGGAPDAFASLLIPLQRSYFVDHLDKTGLNSRGYQRSTRGWVVSFAPGSTELVGSVIKVHGTMSATPGRDRTLPVLQINVDYLFVYAAEAPGQPATLTRLVARDYGNVQFAAFNDPGGPLEPWWNLSGGGVAGARCDVNDGFVHPQFPGGPPDKVHPTGAPVNPYDQATAPPGTPGCRATTGT